MKLLKLLLQAYGPFTAKTVDFSTGPVDLHLIYGPNEAGKSSALRAMIDLRFGIPCAAPMILSMRRATCESAAFF